jgi:hypothetical protein
LERIQHTHLFSKLSVKATHKVRKYLEPKERNRSTPRITGYWSTPAEGRGPNGVVYCTNLHYFKDSKFRVEIAVASEFYSQFRVVVAGVWEFYSQLRGAVAGASELYSQFHGIVARGAEIE